MKIGDYLRRLMAKKGKLHTYVNRPYERSECDICGQICYNREDLQLHLKYNHPDCTSKSVEHNSNTMMLLRKLEYIYCIS
jgi:hypothetical protein